LDIITALQRECSTLERHQHGVEPQAVE